MRSAQLTALHPLIAAVAYVDREKPGATRVTASHDLFVNPTFIQSPLAPPSDRTIVITFLTNHPESYTDAEAAGLEHLGWQSAARSR